MVTAEKQDGKALPIRQIFRLSLHSEEHKDVIKMLQICPMTKKCQLIVDAMRFFDANYLKDLKPQGNPGQTVSIPPFDKTEDDDLSKVSSITDMFL
jgi:hypothetical protein